MTDLGSSPVPPLGAEDHVTGPLGAPLVIEYADLECPFCAVVSGRLSALPLRRVFRHFPVRSSHPRAWPAACAAESADGQDRFWEMCELLFADQARLEDPHLWQRAIRLGLDLERFDADRRSQAVRDRVKADFTSGMRAGVVTTPTVFVDGTALAGETLRQWLSDAGA